MVFKLRFSLKCSRCGYRRGDKSLSLSEGVSISVRIQFHVNQEIGGFPPTIYVIPIGTLDILPGHPTNMWIIEAEPFSIHGIPDVGTVMTEVRHPNVGNHGKEFIVYLRLIRGWQNLTEIQALREVHWVADLCCLWVPDRESHEVDGQGLREMSQLQSLFARRLLPAGLTEALAWAC